MLKKLVTVLSGLIGAAIGISGVWVFHFILDVNVVFITKHRILTAFVGTLGLLVFGNVVYSTKSSKPRSYGMLVLGIACGIFLQAIFYFKNPCPDDCSTDFLLKLGGCIILMVDGFTNLYRKPQAMPAQKPMT